MFEELPPAGPIEKLSDLVYRWRGIDSWPTATATVYNCVYHDSKGGPYYVVTFSYRAGGEMQEGSYGEPASGSSPPFQPGDTFTIRWNPKHPARFYTSNDSSPQIVMAFALILATLATAFFIVSRIFLR